MVQKRRSVCAGNARPQRGNVALQVGANEVLAPEGACGIVVCKEAAREPAAKPQARVVAGLQLANVQRREFEVGDAASQTLAGLLQQRHGRRTEQQELPRALASANTLVDDPAQRRKELRHALNLVEHHQLLSMRTEVGWRIGQLLLVGWALQIQIQPRLAQPPRTPFGDLPRQRGLAHLPWPQEGNRRELAELGVQRGGELAFKFHPCNCGGTVLICKVGGASAPDACRC